jgi:hypothetical protein
MTGWRVGYAVANPEVAVLIAKLAEPLVSCPSTISQKAAEAALALSDSVVESMRRSYRARRDAAAGILGPAGLLASQPSGAFYALVDLRSTGLGSDALARTLLKEERVATAPGATFGTSAEGMVRVSFATATDDPSRAALGSSGSRNHTARKAAVPDRRSTELGPKPRQDVLRVQIERPELVIARQVEHEVREAAVHVAADLLDVLGWVVGDEPAPMGNVFDLPGEALELAGIVHPHLLLAG